MTERCATVTTVTPRHENSFVTQSTPSRHVTQPYRDVTVVTLSELVPMAGFLNGGETVLLTVLLSLQNFGGIG